jgi:oligosaccharide translocation protein RFT1
MVASSFGFVGALTVNAKSAQWQTETTLIYASCFAMAIRIVYALLHARRRARESGGELRMSSIIPRKAVLVAAAGSGVLLRWLAMTSRWEGVWSRWEGGWKGRGELIVAGAVLGLSTLGVIGLSERRDIQEVWKGKTE